VAAGLAYSEGVWSADNEVATVASAAEPAGPVGTVDSLSAATSTIAPDAESPDTTTSATPSTSSASTSTPETRPPSELAVESAGYADGEYLGTAEYTEWGDVQVHVTISDGAIVEVEAIQYPTGRRSSAINGQAVPMLEAEAIQLQTADLDVVSGATYTSRTYADSLQAALDQAALAATQQVAS
jgi:uncharacterized protein with FMN-binding domain